VSEGPPTPELLVHAISQLGRGSILVHAQTCGSLGALAPDDALRLCSVILRQRQPGRPRTGKERQFAQRVSRGVDPLDAGNETGGALSRLVADELLQAVEDTPHLQSRRSCSELIANE
jgi:hypothetical protein